MRVYLTRAMRLRGIDFGYALTCSGARGFYGEGYWFHRLWGGLGLLDFRGATFVSKTLTLGRREGNMEMRGWQPTERLPRCIVVKPVKGAILNAVGLSNPGASSVLDLWSSAPEALPGGPKVLSFLTTGGSAEERLGEILGFATLIRAYLPPGHPVRLAGLAIQLNLSCPNTGLDDHDLLREGRVYLDALSSLDIPVMIKVAATASPHVVQSIADHPACDAVICSNSIPWGKLPSIIDWEGIFGTSVSPLANFGGGSLSGAPLLPVAAAWVKALRRTGFTKPIVGGGGILSRKGVEHMIRSGADAIEVGSAAILRPWRVRGIIHRAIEMKADA